MSTSVMNGSRNAGEPAWEIAELFPSQGQWSESDYLRLTDSTNRLVEFTDGYVEVLPMPDIAHQRLLRFLFSIFLRFVDDADLGELLFSPLRVRIRPGKFREPDLVFRLHEHDDPAQTRYWEGIDLALEVVSEDDPKRDLIEKRSDYAECGIAEYWIVDPRDSSITVLTLKGKSYVEHGRFKRGEQATSILLDGLIVDVSKLFDAAINPRA